MHNDVPESVGEGVVLVLEDKGAAVLVVGGDLEGGVSQQGREKAPSVCQSRCASSLTPSVHVTCWQREETENCGGAFGLFFRRAMVSYFVQRTAVGKQLPVYTKYCKNRSVTRTLIKKIHGEPQVTAPC